MALVHSGFFLYVTLTDASGKNKSTMRFDLDYADWATLNTAVGAGDITQIITDLNLVTDGLITGYTVGEAFAEDTDVHAASGVEVENVALLSCKINGQLDKVVILRIPAPVVGIFESEFGEGRNVIDPTDVNLQTWLAHFGTAGEILVSDGESIADPSVTGNVKGKRIHRGSRKG